MLHNQPKLKPGAQMSMALECSDIIMAKLALERGLDLASTHEQDGEPWVIYCLKNSSGRGTTTALDMLKLLLDNGANPSQPGLDKRTPLMLVVGQGPETFLTALLEAKADPNAVDKDGWSALMLLYLTGYSYHPTNFSRPNHERAAHYAQQLINHGADPNLMPFGSRNTALMLGATKGMIEYCEVLIKAGAKVDLRDGAKRRPSDVARQFGHLECAQMIAKFEEIVDSQVDLDVMTPAAQAKKPARGMRL